MTLQGSVGLHHDLIGANVCGPGYIVVHEGLLSWRRLHQEGSALTEQFLKLPLV